jgi:hypothetical protein
MLRRPTSPAHRNGVEYFDQPVLEVRIHRCDVHLDRELIRR